MLSECFFNYPLIMDCSQTHFSKIQINTKSSELISVYYEKVENSLPLKIFSIFDYFTLLVSE